MKCPWCGTDLDSLDSALYHADSVHVTQTRRSDVIKAKWEEARLKSLFTAEDTTW